MAKYAILRFKEINGSSNYKENGNFGALKAIKDYR
jgi:hypothetical protein